jgi:hypothetical protein
VPTERDAIESAAAYFAIGLLLLFIWGIWAFGWTTLLVAGAVCLAFGLALVIWGED